MIINRITDDRNNDDITTDNDGKDNDIFVTWIHLELLIVTITTLIFEIMPMILMPC